MWYYLIKYKIMIQTGVTKRAVEFIKKECGPLLDKQLLTLAKAFNRPRHGIDTITISGRTLRKIFNNEYVHPNTIENTIKELGGKIILINGKIDIEHEEETEV